MDSFDCGVEHRVNLSPICGLIFFGHRINDKFLGLARRQVSIPFGDQTCFGKMQKIFGAIIHLDPRSFSEVNFVYY